MKRAPWRLTNLLTMSAAIGAAISLTFTAAAGSVDNDYSADYSAESNIVGPAIASTGPDTIYYAPETSSGTSTTVVDLSRIFGVNAIEFTGSGYIEIDALGAETAEATISAWIYRPDIPVTGGVQTLWGFGVGGGYRAAFVEDGGVSYIVSNTDTGIGQVPIPTGTFFLEIDYDATGNTREIRIDSATVFTFAGNDARDPVTHLFTVGSLGGVSEPLADNTKLNNFEITNFSKLPMQEGYGPDMFDVTGKGNYGATRGVVTRAKMDNVPSWNLIQGHSHTDTAFITLWNAPTNNHTIKIPTFTSTFPGVYSGIIQWETEDGVVLSTDTFSGHSDPTLTKTFPTAGRYRCKIVGSFPWFYLNNGANKLDLLAVDNLGQVGVWSLAKSFSGAANMTKCVLGNTDAGKLVNNLSYTWQGCSSMVEFPDVDRLPLVNNLYSTWNNCTSMVRGPFVNSLSLVETLRATWNNCPSMVYVPEVSRLVLVNTLRNTWTGAASATNFPSVSALTKVSSLHATWQGCTNMEEAPDVSTLVLNGTLHATWSGCKNLRQAPHISGMHLVITMYSTFRNCLKLENAPDISGFDRLTLMLYTYSDLKRPLANVTVPTNAPNLSTAHRFLATTIVSTQNIDDIVATLAATCRRNSNTPINVPLHLGLDNHYSSAAAADVAYLTGLGWTLYVAGEE